MLVINITYTKQNNLYYTISIILHWLCAKCQGKLLVLTKFCQGKKNSLFSKNLLFPIFLQPPRLQNLQLQIQSCVSFQLKLEICAVPLTSFCLLCVTNAFRKQPTNWRNKSWANCCCTSSESWIFLLSIWAIPQSIK